MKIKTDPRPDDEVERAALLKWHLWFAWYPVEVAPGESRWLERVWRRGRVLLSRRLAGEKRPPMFYCDEIWEWDYCEHERGMIRPGYRGKQDA